MKFFIVIFDQNNKYSIHYNKNINTNIQHLVCIKKNNNTMWCPWKICLSTIDRCKIKLKYYMLISCKLKG